MSKLQENDKNLLLKMFNDNVNDINNAKTFINMNRLVFAKYVSKCTQLKRYVGARLYSAIFKQLKQTAQTNQFGRFLSDLDMDAVNSDYYHILNAHINNGTENTIKNTLQFFENVVHYNDTG
eukprot:133823_1